MGSCNPSGSACISCRNLVFFDQKSTQTERHRTNFWKKKITPGLSFPPSSNFNLLHIASTGKNPRHPNQNPISSHVNSPWLRPLQRTRRFSLWKRHVGEVLHATFPPWNLKFCQVEPSGAQQVVEVTPAESQHLSDLANQIIPSEKPYLPGDSMTVTHLHPQTLGGATEKTLKKGSQNFTIPKRSLCLNHQVY